MNSSQIFKSIDKFIRFFVPVLCSVFMLNNTLAQETTISILSDTLKPTSIPLERIPLASGEAAINLNRLAESLISEDQIALMRSINDHLMVTIDSALNRQKRLDLESLNNRHLKNIKSYWTDYKTRAQKDKINYSGRIKTLDNKRKSLAEQKMLWKNTKVELASKDVGPAISNIIDKITVKIDSVDNLISAKTIEIIQILSDVSIRAVEIEDKLDKILSIMTNRQKHILAKTDPYLWKLDFRDEGNWNFKQQTQLFYETDIALMIQYFKRNHNKFIYYLIFLVLLVFLFRYLNTIFDKVKRGLTTQYELAVKKILSKPISAGLILGLFSSILIFPNRPLIFTDIMVLLVATPLILIVSTIGTDIKYRYVYLFACILVLRFFNYIIPPEFLTHRLIILIIGIFEVVFFFGLLKYLRQQAIQNHFLRNLMILLLVMHIAIAIFGIAGDLFGSVMMADQAVNLVIQNIFIGFLVFVSSVILIGFVHFAMDGKYLKKLNFVQKYDTYLKNRTSGVIFTVGAVFWIVTVMRLVGVDDIMYTYLGHVFDTKYKIGSGTFTIGSIILFFFVIWLSVVVSKIVRIVLEEDILERLPLKKGVPRLISVMTRYPLVVAGVFIAIS